MMTADELKAIRERCEKATMRQINKRWKFIRSMEWPPDSSNKASSVYEYKDLNVLVSIATMSDDSLWWHLSISKTVNGKLETPTWLELAAVKKDFMGDDVEAYQILPKAEDYIRVSECLHMFARVDGQRGMIANLKEIKWEKAP